VAWTATAPSSTVAGSGSKGTLMSVSGVRDISTEFFKTYLQETSGLKVSSHNDGPCSASSGLHVVRLCMKPSNRVWKTSNSATSWNLRRESIFRLRSENIFQRKCVPTRVVLIRSLALWRAENWGRCLGKPRLQVKGARACLIITLLPLQAPTGSAYRVHDPLHVAD
jgi:hypothetical protein